MRLLVIASLLTVALAGCTAPVEDPDPLFGVCPQWLDGDASSGDLEARGQAVFFFNDTMTHLDGNLSLDRYHVVFTDIATDGVLEVRAFATDDDRALRFTDHRDPDMVRTPTFLALDDDSGTVEVDIFLSDLTHGAEPEPSDLRLELSGQDGATGTLAVEVTPGYRVCGAVF